MLCRLETSLLTHGEHTGILEDSTMRRSVIGLILARGIFVALLAAAAQQPTKMHRVGLLHGGSPPPQILEGFRHGLRDLGYVEGQNLVIELRAAGGSAERLRDGAAALVQLP